MTCGCKASVSLGALMRQCEPFLKSLAYSLKEAARQNCLLNDKGGGGERYLEPNIREWHPLLLARVILKRNMIKTRGFP